MAKANVILQNSILWNLREVTKLAEEIKTHCGDVDCLSWRYPLASCSELEIFKLLQANRNLDNYTYILELTYDRLLYLFNLMIKYLESMDSLKKFRPDKNVYRPRTLSLASVLYMIWDRIQACVENARRESPPPMLVSGNSEKELHVSDLTPKNSTCTQSDLCSISRCSCCDMVQTFITQLILEVEKLFERHDFSSAISNERKLLREYLVETTNWSAMTRWLTAIVTDFSTLSEKLDQLTSNSRKLRHRLESGERKMKSKLEQQEEDARKLLKDKELKISEMKQKLEKLTEEKNSLNETVKKKSTEVEKKLFKIEQLKKNFEKKFKEKKDEKLKQEEEMGKLRKGLETERKKLEEVEIQKKKLEENLESQNAKAEEEKNYLLNKLNKAESRVESLEQETVHLKSVIEEKDNKIKEYSERIMEAFPALSETPKPKYAASGDPETDIENQMEANRLRMELLKTENESLQTTLNKIKTLKG